MARGEQGGERRNWRNSQSQSIKFLGGLHKKFGFYSKYIWKPLMTF